jgi:hypothetical protein
VGQPSHRTATGPTSLFVGAVGRSDEDISIILSTEFAANN